MTEASAVEDKPKALPVTVDLRLSRLALMAGSFAAIVILLMAPFHGRGVTVHSFLSANYTEAQQKDMSDNYNSYSSNIVSAFVTPSDWILGTMLPVIYLAFASRRHVQTNAAFVSVVFFMGSTLLIKYLINNGFNAVNVQIVPEQVEPFVASSDLRVNTDALEIMSVTTTNVSNPVTEKGVNFLTNTVLRNVVAPIVLRKPTVCSAIEANDTSQYATGLVQSFGFPTASWQSTMLPSNEFVLPSWSKIYLNDAEASNTTLTIDIATSAELLIHGLHVSRYAFRWLDNSASPFNITGLLHEQLQSGASGDTGTIGAAMLLGLVPSESGGDDDSDSAYFLSAATELFRKSLAGAVNISQNEATMEFRHVDLWDNISFDSLTLEIPLRKNFYYRKLVLSDDGTRLVEDTAATANYTSIFNVDNTVNDTVYYDLDLTVDCGPNSGVCAMPRVLEYDFNGNEYHPEAQIKATGMCINEDGTEEFQISYTYDSESSAEASVPVEAYWACQELSNTAFWIMSLGSRIEGNDMYEGPAPDAQVTSLDSRRATIVDPRKIYSLTVGRIGFDLLDLAQSFNASCDADSGDCLGPRYLLDIAADQAFSNASATYSKFILVGQDSIPMDSLSAYAYNDTESGNAYNGAGQGTRWLSLMALSRPSEDSAFTVKGDVLLSYNFYNSMLDSTKTRSGDACSEAAEDYLSQIVNNHYYIEDGLQASYTAGMYFIFQNGVVRSIENVTSDGNEWTLDFDGNRQFMDLTVSIPTKSLIITFCGVALILLGAIFVAIFSRCGQRSLLKNPDEMTPDMVADMMLNDSKYPPMLLVRRFEQDGVEHGDNTFQQFRIDGLWLHHEAMGMSLSLPLNADLEPPGSSRRIGATAERGSPQPEVPYYLEAQTPLSNGAQAHSDHDPQFKHM